MLRRYEPDMQIFIEKAKRHGAEVSVFTDARVMPRVVEGQAVVMQPVILLHYTFEFTEEEQKEKWVFEDSVDDTGGKVDISKSLLARLRADADVKLRERDTTMALPPRAA